VNNRVRAGLAGLATGLVVAVSAASPASAATATIDVPTDFVSQLSDTRATGHYEVVGTGLRVWTQGATSTDKVAEYVAAPAPLAVVGEPNLEYTPTTGSIPPGFQLVVDFDGDGGVDGILVGESVYAGDWWLSNSSAQFVKDGAPSHTGGSGSANHGTLDAWRAAFPNAQVEYIGFSLGSGVLGDGVINALNYNGTRYTFAEAVVLGGKEDCKNGGWATSTDPVFRNQGDCVSHFASGR
jgi:hypothetical protein